MTAHEVWPLVLRRGVSGASSCASRLACGTARGPAGFDCTGDLRRNRDTGQRRLHQLRGAASSWAVAERRGLARRSARTGVAVSNRRIPGADRDLPIFVRRRMESGAGSVPNRNACRTGRHGLPDRDCAEPPARPGIACRPGAFSRSGAGGANFHTHRCGVRGPARGRRTAAGAGDLATRGRRSAHRRSALGWSNAAARSDVVHRRWVCAGSLACFAGGSPAAVALPGIPAHYCRGRLHGGKLLRAAAIRS